MSQTPADPHSDDDATMLLHEFRTHSALPFLFLGSGISRRYLGVPDWPGLLRIFAEQCELDFDYVYASEDGDLPRVATHIAERFHEVWWHSPLYAEQVSTYRHLATNRPAALKIAISCFLSQHSIDSPQVPGRSDVTLKSEVAVLRDVVVDGIVTTNYDDLTDALFPSFQSYIGQDELLFSDAQFIAEVYKIHGSASAPTSLIVTEADYNELKKRNHYLSAKLLTIFAEHPIIFVGYSMSDGYIQEIIRDLREQQAIQSPIFLAVKSISSNGIATLQPN